MSFNFNNLKKFNKFKDSFAKPTISKNVLIECCVVTLLLSLCVGYGLCAAINTTNNSASNVTVANADGKMPSDAANSGLNWTIKLLHKLDGKISQNFFADPNGAKTLTDMTNGNYDNIPTSVRENIIWADELKNGSNTISYNSMKASGYSGLIMAWSVYTQALQHDKKFKPNPNSVIVDAAHNTVYVPFEAICGVPADANIILRWQNRRWVVDGTATALQVAGKARVEQLRIELAKRDAQKQKQNVK